MNRIIKSFYTCLFGKSFKNLTIVETKDHIIADIDLSVEFMNMGKQIKGIRFFFQLNKKSKSYWILYQGIRLKQFYSLLLNNNNDIIDINQFNHGRNTIIKIEFINNNRKNTAVCELSYIYDIVNDYKPIWTITTYGFQ